MVKYIFNDVSRTSATSKMKPFVSLANDFQLLTNVLKNSLRCCES